MDRLDIPFNISILELNDKTLQAIKPVRALDTFEGNSKNFHEDGLFSQTIFGRVGDALRNKRFSYINIKINIFHPIIYNTLTELKSFYGEILSGKGFAAWSEEEKDFVKVDPLSGETGFAFFIQHWNKIEFKQTGSDKRSHAIALIEKYKSVALTDKIVVLPAGLRDYEITGDGRESEDEFNTIYRRILSLSNPIHEKLVTQDSIRQLNSTRYNLQLEFNKLYDTIKAMLEGKKKLIVGKWAGRGIRNGTRNVISTTNVVANELGSKANVGVNDTVIGLFQYLKASLPVSMYQIKNNFLQHVFPGPSTPAMLVNKKTLKVESVRLKSTHYDAWMSDEGLEATLNSYGEEALRHKQLEIEGYWMGLIYKGEGVFKIFQDIDELPAKYDRKDVYPLTFTELLYIAVYEHAPKYPMFITRYPITGFGSVYPSYPYLKPTLKNDVRAPLDENWEIDTTKAVAYQFPTNSAFVNSMSPSPSHLTGLGADF